jgi:hypothetical protein
MVSPPRNHRDSYKGLCSDVLDSNHRSLTDHLVTDIQHMKLTFASILAATVICWPAKSLPLAPVKLLPITEQKPANDPNPVIIPAGNNTNTTYPPNSTVPLPVPEVGFCWRKSYFRNPLHRCDGGYNGIGPLCWYLHLTQVSMLRRFWNLMFPWLCIKRCSLQDHNVKPIPYC